MKKKKKHKKIREVGAAVMAGPSGPQYDTTGNNRLSEHNELSDIKKLAGISKEELTINNGSNISLTGTEKARLMKEHNIQPGTPEWFKLWFSRPYMTQEKPIG
jgi:hypothetical protein